ncbi:MAG TPA: beta-ketoacyl-ACP synthase II [Myxococcota bacterium]|nr:beta-ketoacyl-ACP synthase II [Myxococcota bacterium]
MSRHATPERRVVVTGLGAVTPLGIGVDETWRAALEGRSGVGSITAFDASEYPVRFAAEVKGELDLGDLSVKEARRLDRVIALALVAAREALAHSGLEIGDANRERIGVAIGSGIGGLITLQESIRALTRSGPRRVQPFTIPMAICNMTSGYVAIRHGIHGPNLCHVSACATGAHSIGEAARAIARGDVDAMLAGGTEAPIAEVGLAGFASMRALSTRNDAPERASRPFDRERDGFVIGEGAGVLVLESLETAQARGAKILCELRGYGASGDAAHIAQPTENAEGAQRCMRSAIADAGLAPADVDYLNAHATSTPAGDVSEARAIRAVFGDHAPRLAVSATKSMTGHLLGAAGAVEALLCVRTLETGQIPPTINLDTPDPECELDHVANKARRQDVRIALSNSFGFGGTNAALLFARLE